MTCQTIAEAKAQDDWRVEAQSKILGQSKFTFLWQECRK